MPMHPTRPTQPTPRATLFSSALPVLGLLALTFGLDHTRQVDVTIQETPPVEEVVMDSALPEYLEDDTDGEWFRLAPNEDWAEMSRRS